MALNHRVVSDGFRVSRGFDLLSYFHDFKLGKGDWDVARIAQVSANEHPGLPSECRRSLGRIDGDHSTSFPTLVKYLERDIGNPMANWKVIALISGNIEAISGPAAQDRPGTHEWVVWEGPAADKAEALKCVEKADPRVDLEWMRVRHERDLDIR
jgi:hypothetical protein